LALTANGPYCRPHPPHLVPPNRLFSRSFSSRYSPPSFTNALDFTFFWMRISSCHSFNIILLPSLHTTTTVKPLPPVAVLPRSWLCLTRVTVPDNLRKPAFRGLADVGAVLAHEEHLVQVCCCLRLLDNGPFLRNRHHHPAAEHIQWRREHKQSIPKPHIRPL